jgi:hypothetical protein
MMRSTAAAIECSERTRDPTAQSNYSNHNNRQPMSNEVCQVRRMISIPKISPYAQTNHNSVIFMQINLNVTGYT